ncbi:carboxypeptidase-like regulatory domain-containing protein [Flavobacteriaceae bacterium TP-CH-4]|uniref:Carboxypeptidase-like regulatory domain-containing protein n=1 Tax=Pelagihabitans pacificus TaxID=2696054 RepID=A0A967AU15_9FLAO|nr:carboxypeptidase-like regulatory domain-containing protein [Pelagihabitans pacificus]NHF60381.1 carboxypeptidase-like regulatory domain-containing protein [Pelagihabitans pacificus]
MTIKHLSLLALILGFQGYAQQLSSVVLDSATKKPIPYVTVRLNNKGMITNEEGRFTFRLDGSIKETDSLFLSCIGYASLGKPINEFTENVIYLPAKAIELNPVIVTNKKYTPKEIIEEVEKNLVKNYHQGYSKKRLFLRQTFRNNIIKTDYTLKKSTIDAFNKKFLDSVIRTVPKSSTFYTEILGDLYGASDSEEQKLDLIKASELYDKSRELDYDKLEEKFNKIIKANVKTDSYFKIKSGIFGTKIDSLELGITEVDSTDAVALQKELEKKKKNEENRKKFFSKYQRETLGNLYGNLPIFEDTDYNVLFKPGRYDLILENFTYVGDDAVYVIGFKPKRSEEFQGRIFVNSDDFAVIRMDFENVEPLRKFKLLGVSLNEYLARGSIIFSKGDNEKYHLRYYNIEKGNRIGFKRPVKIIEKNKNVKGRRKQNELSLKVDAAFGSTNRYELVVFDLDPINSGTYEAFKENNNLLPTYMPNYDPTFWAGYDIIEPNKAIKEFTSQVELGD